MSLTIPLISRLPVESKYIWIEQLRQSLQSEAIDVAENMTLEDLNRAEIAIVAAPDLELLKTMKSLKWVQALSAGVEGLIDVARENKFQVARMVDPNLAKTMAESVLTWTLFIKNKLPIYLKQQQEKKWIQQTYSTPHQCKVGILGLGEMGKASAVSLLKNGFSVLGWSRSEKQIKGVNCYYGDQGLMDFASLCDVLICLLPLTNITKGMIDLELLNKLSSGASVINFS